MIFNTEIIVLVLMSLRPLQEGFCLEAQQGVDFPLYSPSAC